MILPQTLKPQPPFPVLSHILITGASSGLGAALATAYAAPGITLSLHGRHAERLAAVAVTARNRGAVVETHAGDVTAADDLGRWLTARDTALPIDLLVANAGISAGSAKAGATGTDRQVLATNLDGVLNTVLPLLGPMTQRRRGQIALVSSLASFRGLAGSAAYSASKAAVRVYGEALRLELAERGVGVTVICPGFVRTPMTDVNRFHMPLLMSADCAAALIRRRLPRNPARIAFPWPMYAAVWLLAALSPALVDRMARWLPRKG